jgi:hypothetical protein
VQFENVTGNAPNKNMLSSISFLRVGRIDEDCRHVLYLMWPSGRRSEGSSSHTVQSAPAWPLNSIEALPIPFKALVDYG